MPYADSAQQRLPYQSGSESSHDGARHAGRSLKTVADRAKLMAEYVRAGRDGVTDGEAVFLTGLPVNIICARRNELGVVALTRRMGANGVRVTAWGLKEFASC